MQLRVNLFAHFMIVVIVNNLLGRLSDHERAVSFMLYLLKEASDHFASPCFRATLLLTKVQVHLIEYLAGLVKSSCTKANVKEIKTKPNHDPDIVARRPDPSPE